MKKISTMMLMLLVAFMGMTLQSCGSDDEEKASYTFTAALTDQGTLTDEQASIIQALLSQIQETHVSTLSVAKSSLDETINLTKSTFPTIYDYVITYYIKDSAGKTVYSRKLIAKNKKITIE